MSSVQINLLPDQRQNRIRDKNTRQLATGVATAIVLSCAGILVLLIIITQAQGLQIKSLTKSIQSRQSQLLSTPNVQDIVTTQQHLASLNKLYPQRTYMSKFFTALQSVASGDIVVNTLGLDSSNLLTVQGQAKNYAAAAKLAQAMKASNVTLGQNASPTNVPDFSNVTLSNLSSDQSGKVSYSISANLSSGVTSGQ